MIGGYTGYVSFGNVVFFGLGAYTTASLWQHFGISRTSLCAIAMRDASSRRRFRARSSGVPILRLKGHYFGIATLGIALATQEIIANVDWLGGGSGFTVRQIDNYSLYYLRDVGACARPSMLATYLHRAIEVRLCARRDSRERRSCGDARA